jgi:hypothetical protein
VINLSDDLRTARLQLLADAMSGGTLTLYNAPRPAIGAAITTQTALVEVEIPAGLTAVDSLLTLSLEITVIAVEGEAVWGRIMSATETFVADGDCGLPSSNAVFKLKTTYLTVGANLVPLLATFAES